MMQMLNWKQAKTSWLVGSFIGIMWLCGLITWGVMLLASPPPPARIYVPQLVCPNASDNSWYLGDGWMEIPKDSVVSNNSGRFKGAN